MVKMMKKFAVLKFLEEKTVGVAPSCWLDGDCKENNKVVVNWEEGSKKTPYDVKILGLSDDREEAEAMMDNFIESGKLREKRKSLSENFSDSSDDETLQEKQKRIRVSYSAGQKELKAKFLQKAQDKVKEMQENSSDLKDIKDGSSEIAEDDTDKVKDADTQNDIDMNKENEQTPFKKRTTKESETPFRLQKRPQSETTVGPLNFSKTLRHVKKSSWIRNLEDVMSSDEEEDVRLSKEELLTKCQMQGYEMRKLKKDFKQLKQENDNLRAALGLATELPELLQKIRRLKSSTQSSSPTSTAMKPTVRRSPLTPVTPVTPVSPVVEDEDEGVNFGDKWISKKELIRHNGFKPSHLINYLMEEVFDEVELTTCSLTGSKGRSSEIKPALDGEKLMAIIGYTKDQWKVGEEEIKKTIRMKLNNVCKRRQQEKSSSQAELEV